MLLVLSFGGDADLVEIPDTLKDQLETLQEPFYQWLFDPNNHHSYWTKTRGGTAAVCYRAEAFVEWLNTFILEVEQARIVRRYLPNLHF